ncbi:peptidoglycan DD-metalloendopeptidase family protein [Neobacillus sp. SuZ13]|uniref:murein hydrolase activator EnvC family protein n=1 Tax=Neobacillus sp. SuZ13 TaxID=3047875 RepID=UPI0024BFB841|nr:peptidoglycan DD-metalloendopeptidase family protein [Neobacillus sp. SuZ13]WHY66329.1 peptidoglycan DD-metalloendopeptidase family protein [Neobacillus sp. SuZ13]
MKKSVITSAVALAVGLGTIFGGVSVKTEAASLSSLKGEQNKIHDKRTNIQSGINQANDKINTLKSQQADVKSEMKRLDFAIEDTTTKIDDKSKKIKDTKAEVTKLQAETKVIKERINKRNVLLKDRARSYQENGGMVNYLDVLMGSTSFSDFIDRANAVATIVQADQDIIKQHEADKQELAQKQAKVEKDLASLEKMLADLKTMNQQLNVQKKEKDKMLASLKDQEEEVHEGMMELQEEEQILAAQEAAIKQAIQMEKEAQAKAAEEAKRRTTSSNNGNDSGSQSNTTPNVSSGVWTQPTTGYRSSGFGGRGDGNHYGVDIANGTKVPIVAAANGVVIRSYYSSTYGNCIFVSHSINGQVYTTVYAHMTQRYVGSGARVKKGQKIGLMGNTGASRGQHLHFELHKGPWTQDKRYAINPVGIVPLP